MELAFHHCTIMTWPFLSTPVVLLITIRNSMIELSSNQECFLVLCCGNSFRPSLGHFDAVMNHHLRFHVPNLSQWAIEPRIAAPFSLACKASGQDHLPFSSYLYPGKG